MSARIPTAKILLLEYGPTMTPAQVQRHFMPGLSIKAIQNRVSRGDLPPTTDGVFDSQEVGDWWESHRTVRVPDAA